MSDSAKSTRNQFNQILILDSIPAGELNTAKRLHEDISVRAAAFAPSPAVRRVRVESGDAAIAQIEASTKEAASAGTVPLLHIECHGDDDGLQFADGSLLGWDELRIPLTQLNIATKLNLFVAVAACTGGAIAKSIHPGDRAPFWGFVGPRTEVAPGELERAFVVTGAYRTRGARIQAALLSEGVGHIAPSLDAAIELLKNQAPITFKRFARTFFMMDLFSDHEARFPMRYPD